MTLFADATFLVAIVNKEDAHHQEAKEVLARIAIEARGGPPIVFTDFVFDEVITTLLFRTRRHDLCTAAGQALLDGKAAKMIEVSAMTFKAAWDLFKRRPDKRWSFTDCTSFQMMEAMRMDTALTFDGDFKAAGFKTLP